MMTLSFDEQVEALVDRGVAGDEAAFRAASRSRACPSRRSGRCLTIVARLVPVATAAARVERRGRPVVLGHLEPRGPRRASSRSPRWTFRTRRPTSRSTSTSAPASRNVRPEDALRDHPRGRALAAHARRGHRAGAAAARGHRHATGASRWPARGAATSACRRSGSARAGRSSDGAGTATLTPGSGRPRAHDAPRQRDGA